MTDLYPPGLNHAGLHATTGDMPLTDQPVTFENIIVAMTTAVPDSIAVNVSITSSAISGETTAIYALAIADNASGDLEVAGLTAIARVPAGIDIGSGLIRGARVRFEALANSTLGGPAEGLHIDLRGEAGVTFSHDIRGIYIQSNLVTAAGTMQMIRLEENGGVTWDELIGAHFGGTSDCEFFFEGTPAVRTGWSNVGDKVGLTNAGWLRVNLAGNFRFIQLYGP